MRPLYSSLLLLFIATQLQSFASEPVINSGDVPQTQLSANKWEYIVWDSIGPWETIDVTTKGIIPGLTDDIGPIVNSIISNGSGRRILKFPSGTYQIITSINISKSDIQIIGEGSTTRFYAYRWR